MPTTPGRMAVRLAALCSLGAAVICSLAVAWFTFGAARRPETPRAAGPSATAAGPRAVPLRVEPAVHFPGAFDALVVRKAVESLKVDRPTSLSHAFHVLRLFGPGATMVDTDTGDVLPCLDIILDSRACLPFFGNRPTLVETRDGVRCRTADPGEGQPEKQAERQAHTDQFLAVLAELGIPLSHPLRTAKGTHTVRAMLDDSLANFDLKGREIEWSVLAFALYLPPRASWTDKYKRVRTFDQLAGELMSRPYADDLACGGTHLLYSLAVLLRADAALPVLTPEVRQAVRDHLGRTAADVARTQSPEGWWAPRWHEHLEAPPGGPKGEGPDWVLVLNTGHHLEWMAILPDELRPPPECFLRAGRWLQARLLEDPRKIVLKRYCPYSHAGRMLLIMSGASDPLRPAVARGPTSAARIRLAGGAAFSSLFLAEGGVR